MGHLTGGSVARCIAFDPHSFPQKNKTFCIQRKDMVVCTKKEPTTSCGRLLRECLFFIVFQTFVEEVNEFINILIVRVGAVERLTFIVH